MPSLVWGCVSISAWLCLRKTVLQVISLSLFPHSFDVSGSAVKVPLRVSSCCVYILWLPCYCLTRWNGLCVMSLIFPPVLFLLSEYACWDMDQLVCLHSLNWASEVVNSSAVIICKNLNAMPWINQTWLADSMSLVMVLFSHYLLWRVF